MIRSSTIGFVVFSMIVGVILFKIKYEVVSLENELNVLRKSIYDRKESIHILKAEWAHLTNPDRIQKLAIKYLTQGRVLADNSSKKNNQKNIVVSEKLDKNNDVKDDIKNILSNSKGASE